MKILMKMKSVVKFQVKNSKITEHRGRQSSRFHVFSRLQSIFDIFFPEHLLMAGF